MTDRRSHGPAIAGRCPACKNPTLFAGVGGHVTCSRLDCPAPTAADDALREDGYAFIGDAEVTELRARAERAEAEIVALTDHGLSWRERAEQAEAANARVRQLIDSYPPGSDFVQCGAAQIFRDYLDGTKGSS